MRLRVQIAEYQLIVAPEIYQPYVVLEKGKKLLYCEAQDTIHGTLKAALLFCKKLVKYFQQNCLNINPYDVCVFNKMVNGNHQTVVEVVVYLF